MIIGFSSDSGVVDGGYAWLIWHVRMVCGWLPVGLCVHESAILFMLYVCRDSSYRTIELHQKLPT